MIVMLGVIGDLCSSIRSFVAVEMASADNKFGDKKRYDREYEAIYEDLVEAGLDDEARRDSDAIEAVFRKLNAQPLLLVGDELCLSPLNKSTAMCLEDCVPFDRPFHVPQGGFRAVAVNVVNGGRDQIVINEGAEGPPGVVDQIDRVVDQLRIVGRILPLEDVMEMRRQGFDDRVMEGPQNIRQEFLLV
jgi:hypothetical protein